MPPRECGSGSICHRRFRDWVRPGIFKKLWIRVLETYDNKKGIRWDWQSMDSISIKSPLERG
jgi:transposase